MKWIAAIDEIKAHWPSNLNDAAEAKRFLAISETLTPRNTQARILWHELRACCLETLGDLAKAEQEALAADGLYDTVPYVQSHWMGCCGVLIDVSISRQDWDAALRWVDRAEHIWRTVPEFPDKVTRLLPDAPENMRESIRQTRAYLALKEDVAQRLRQHSEPVWQADFCRQFDDANLARRALYELEKEGRLVRVKQGRSYWIRLSD